VTVDACLGMPFSGNSQLTGIKLFPVPCKNNLEVQLPDNTCKVVSLYNSNGCLVKQIERPGSAFVINVAGLPGGIYLLVTDNNLHARVLVQE